MAVVIVAAAVSAAVFSSRGGAASVGFQNWEPIAPGTPLDQAVQLQEAIEKGTDSRPIVGKTSSPGSLGFPSGTTYEEAVSITAALLLTGRVSPSVAVLPPLQSGVVVDQASDGSNGPRIDLLAPFGYDPSSGQAFGPSFNLEPSVGPDGTPAPPSQSDSPNGPWPVGARVDVPILPSCMRAIDGRRQGPACSSADLPTIDVARVRAEVLDDVLATAK